MSRDPGSIVANATKHGKGDKFIYLSKMLNKITENYKKKKNRINFFSFNMRTYVCMCVYERT